MYGTHVLDAYLMAMKAEGHSPRTTATYRKILHRWGRYQLAHDSDIIRATTDDLVAYRCACQDGKLSPRTQHLYATVLRCLYGWLAANDYIQKDPSAKLKRLKAIPTVATPPSLATYKTLISSIPMDDYAGVRDRAILLTFFATGLRISELCSLTIGQIDFDKREFPVVGKGNKRRLVIIHEFAAHAVQEYIDLWRSKIPGSGLTPALWLSLRGFPMTPNKVREAMDRRRKLAGIDSVNVYPSGMTKSVLTPHNLRALFATQLWRAGASLPIVQQLLGHESLETTRIYLGVSSDDLHAAIPLLGLEAVAA